MVDAQDRTEARRHAQRIVADGAGTVRCVLMYGSRLWGVPSDPHGAFDFFLVVEDYSCFHRALRSAGRIHRPAWLFTTLAAVLPPNSIAHRESGAPDVVAKCLVISQRDFERGLGPSARDHFLIGRLIQRAEIVWAASERDHAWTTSLLVGARERVLDWMTPFLDAPFDAQSLGRRILEVCYGGELRPEPPDRVSTLHEAQSDHFERWLTPLLDAAAARGTLHRVNGQYQLARPVNRRVALQWRWYFAKSRIRSTARWAKYVITFDGWLAYLVRKVERHTGQPVQLRWIERRWPLIFLWPRAVAVLRRRMPQRHGDAS